MNEKTKTILTEVMLSLVFAFMFVWAFSTLVLERESYHYSSYIENMYCFNNLNASETLHGFNCTMIRNTVYSQNITVVKYVP